ncbi:MAG: EAL domain-containing protein [Gammaproteobacteria bacterium]|nr:EAL domain-containing protein [Gammaproteobacteria bacterium]
MTDYDEDDLLEIIEDDEADQQKSPELFWKILIIDDDEEVHRATLFALNKTELLGRSLKMLHAYSAAEARNVLSAEEDVAVILLDVVMEHNEAGLELVSVIRDKLKLDEVRIILRTGQPGYAPETEVITEYDINDYRSKSELTQTRLVTSLVSALRSYQQIKTISNSRKGLAQIIEATSDLLSRNGLNHFASGIITQLSSFFSMSLDGLIAVRRQENETTDHIKIIAAGDRYQNLINHELNELHDNHIEKLIQQALLSGQSVMEKHEAVLYFAGKEQSIAAYVTADGEIPRPEQDILHLFCQNIGMCSDNLALVDHLHDQIYIDQTTGLSNRNQFVENFQKNFEKDKVSKSLIVINIDHFNSIVETIGARRSSQILQSFGQRLAEKFQSDEVAVARLGGDIFSMVGPDEAIDPVKIQDIFESPLPVGDMSIPVSITMGVAPLSKTDDYVTAISAAYSALKKAKFHHRGGYYTYSEEMSQDLTQRVNILNSLRDALKADEFYLVYQPQLDLKTDKVIGLETLIRWVNNKGEFIAPSVFIPIAENSGMIQAIGRWVFENSCKNLARLHQQGFEDISISVNVSAAQLKDPKFISFVESTLQAFNVEARYVDIEITETLAMEDIEYCISIIDGLKQVGVHVSLDDFGTGYSSLAYLQRMNLDRIKVDRSFVMQIGQSLTSERIIRSIINLGKQLELDILAEGIETADQESFLKNVNCDSAQGYRFAKPMDYESLLQWLNK